MALNTSYRGISYLHSIYNRSNKTGFLQLRYSFGNICLNFARNLSVRVEEVKEINRHQKSAFITLPKENLFCHNVLEGKPQYSVVDYSKVKNEFLSGCNASSENVRDLLLKTDFNGLSAESMCKLFRLVTLDAATNTYLPLSDDMYSDLCAAVARLAKDCSDDQLSTLLLQCSVWPMSESTRAPNFREVWKSLDDECMVRWRGWPLSRKLYFIDLWFTLRLIKISDFVFHCMNSLAKKVNRLGPQEIIQMLFYLNALRANKKGYNMYNIEYRFESIAPTLSLCEIGVAALGFFKTQTRFQSPGLSIYIIQRLIVEIESVPEITLSSILKCLRLSMSAPVWGELPRLLDSLYTQLDRLTLKCSAHITLLMTPSQTLHPHCLNAIAEKLLMEIPSARLKDMEKIIFSLSLLNYDPPTSKCIYSVVVDELKLDRRKQEIEEYPKAFIALVHYLSLKGFFPYDLINKVLDMDFIKSTYGKNKFVFGREILSIDGRVAVECEDYKGNRLPADLICYLSKRYSQYLPNADYKIPRHHQLAYNLKTALDELLGTDCAMFVFTLPFHPRADILFQRDREGKVVPLPEEIKNREQFSGVVRPPQNGNEWHAVVPASMNMFLSNRTDYNGETSSKLKCLKLLGYKTHVISIFEYPEDEKTAKDYLRKLLAL